MEKYLIIDTVMIEKHFENKKNNNYLLTASKLITNDKWTLEDTSFLSISDLNKSYPNVSLKIKYFDVDTLQLGILIDDKGGMVWLNHIERLQDTIHIRKWVLFHNILQDTINYQKEFYQYIDDSLVKTYKTINRKRITNPNNVNIHQTVAFILNDTKYTIPLTIATGFILSSGHGYPSRKDEKKCWLYWNEEKKHVKYRKFWISSTRKTKRYSGSLSF